jgi:hypothetical protein
MAIAATPIIHALYQAKRNDKNQTRFADEAVPLPGESGICQTVKHV